MISILTPTYNRAYTLTRLYKSLCSQDSRDFDWIIVDDGSDDNTKNLVFEFISQKKIKITYLYQENSGKHAALNAGYNHGNGKYIFIVDSDDSLEKNAITVINQKINKFPDFLGYCFRKKTFSGLPIGEALAMDDLVMSPTQAANILKGDLAYVFQRALLVRNLFPIFKKEKFVPELYIWNKISDMGKIIFFPKLFIYLCDYLDDGYSKNFKIILRANPQGFSLFYKDQIFREKNIIKKLKNIIRYWQCFIYEYFRK